MRHRGGAPNAAALQATAEARRVVTAPKKKTVRGVGDARFLEALDAVACMLREGRWVEASGLHFVALYADLYFRVYGIQALDLGAKERVFASKLAEDMLHKDFKGDRQAFARYVSWTWSRERSREEWRRENGKTGGRISWRVQFGRNLLADYRVEEARKAAATSVSR